MLITGAVHRYYESRRRIGIEELPDRQEKAAEQKKKRKYRARQQRVRERERGKREAVRFCLCTVV